MMAMPTSWSSGVEAVSPAGSSSAPASDDGSFRAPREPGSRLITSSRRSSTPLPCSADMSTTGFRPSSKNCTAASRATRMSVLFTTATIGLPSARTRCTTSRSPATRPDSPSNTTSTRSAWASARFPCSTTRACSGSSLAPNSPPVSTIEKRVSFHVTGYSIVSRVVPGTAVTMARRVRVMRLNSVDFPTLGRPASTTSGREWSTDQVPNRFAPQRSGIMPTTDGSRCATELLLTP